MALPKAVDNYLYKAQGSKSGPQAMSKALGQAKQPKASSTGSGGGGGRAAASGTSRDTAYRKAVLDVLYSLSTSGQLPPEALQALMGG